jgi:hypothetical protein
LDEKELKAQEMIEFSERQPQQCLEEEVSLNNNERPKGSLG